MRQDVQRCSQHYIGSMIRYAVSILALIFGVTPAKAERITGIIDGRTFVTDERTVRIRGIEVPRMPTAPGRDAKAHLKRTLLAGSISISNGVVKSRGKPVGREMVKLGFAKQVGDYPEYAGLGAEIATERARLSRRREETAAASKVDSVHVPGYYRSGSWVAPHYKSRPNQTTRDNWSTRGNVNPWNGRRGYQRP